MQIWKRKVSAKRAESLADEEYWNTGFSGDAGVDIVVDGHDRQDGDWKKIETGLEMVWVKELQFPRDECVSVLTKIIEHYLVPNERTSFPFRKSKFIYLCVYKLLAACNPLQEWRSSKYLLQDGGGEAPVEHLNEMIADETHVQKGARRWVLIWPMDSCGFCDRLGSA